MSFRERVKRRLLRALLPIPVQVARAEYSLLLTAHDEVAQPTERLLDVALAAVQAARGADVSVVSERMAGGTDYATVWPGEHYRLLAGLVRVVQPAQVVEIGTGAGWSALAMLPHLAPDARLDTFDVRSWRDDPETALCHADFADGRLTQHLDDLTDGASITKHRALLESADLIFMDAAKDGVMERRFLAHFETLAFDRPLLMLFDDIRLWTMLDIWRGIERPKLDLTSFGHWSGTGLVAWDGA